MLEALALWQSRRVHAVLVEGDGNATSATSLCPDLAAEHARTALYTLDVVDGRRLYTLDVVDGRRRHPPRRSDRIDGMGDFRDLRQLMPFEVAR